MKNKSLMTFLMYMRYAQNYRMANIAYNLLITNVREENAIKERSTSEPKHISDILESWKYHFDNHSL